eukprot:UN06554
MTEKTTPEEQERLIQDAERTTYLQPVTESVAKEFPEYDGVNDIVSIEDAN